ncbi:hypothetical protein [Burkholderia sp. L27(2015)]|uniref:hypothetical protein n=1 Tax=Burkholderia sp. L27(2015) TaxID=1641858 RepID=UPI00131C4C37|nr:hypothetical protein [Burkholderia sp. L27(2015)]
MDSVSFQDGPSGVLGGALRGVWVNAYGSSRGIGTLGLTHLSMIDIMNAAWGRSVSRGVGMQDALH